MLQTTALGQTGQQFNPVSPLLLRPPWTPYKAQIMWCDSPYESRPCAKRELQGTGQIVKPDMLTRFARSSSWNRSPNKTNIQREVKTFHEGEYHFSDTQLVPYAPHSHLNLGTVSGGHQKIKRGMTMQKPSTSLPPLPERALEKLSEPWVSPTGDPFHEVHVWEFPHLYVTLKVQKWREISKILRSINLSRYSREWKISRNVLDNIRDSPKQSISVLILSILCESLAMSYSEIEQSIRTIRFGKSGDLEFIRFPFTMNLHAWRLICHLLGDGNIHYRKNEIFPEGRWTQWPRQKDPSYPNLPPKTQRFMRGLIEFLSRNLGGTKNEVQVPKALIYLILGCIPNLTINDLKDPNFIQIVINLPEAYKDYKIQFLTAFFIDDGSISDGIQGSQKKEEILIKIMELCDQLGYDRSRKPPYKQKRDGIYCFRLRVRGIRAFYNDLNSLLMKYNNDPLLGLWFKSQDLDRIVKNISDKRLNEQKQSINLFKEIIKVSSDLKIRSTLKLRSHPEINRHSENMIPKIFNDKLRLLTRYKILMEVLKANGASYRPKRWMINPNLDSKSAMILFKKQYSNRSHKQGYKRQALTTKMVTKALDRLISTKTYPSFVSVSKKVPCSKKQLYKREDLKKLIQDYQIRFFYLKK